MGRITKISLVVLAIVGISTVAHAAKNPDSFLITCTPSLIYSVTISTPADGLTFSNVEMETTYVHPSTVTIQNSGNVRADWKIKGEAVAGNTWQLGSAPSVNTVRLLARLNSVRTETFSTTADLIETTEQNMSSTKYAGDQNGNNVPKNTTRLLSVRLDSPLDSTVDTAQRFRIEIRAYPSGTFE